MSRSFKRTLLTIAFVMVVGLSMVAMPALAATTTLAGDGTDTVDNYAADSGDHVEYSLASDGTDFSTDGTTTALMNVSLDGTEHGVIEQTIDDGTATSETLNMSHADFDTLPGGAGETVTVNVTAWGEDDGGNITTAKDEFTVDITFDNSHASVYVDDDAKTTEERDVGVFSNLANSVSMGYFGVDADEAPDLHTYEQTGVAVDGSNTTVHVHDATSTGGDAFDDAMRDEMEAGDVIGGATATVDDTPVLAFYDEADTDVVDADNDTYAVYDSADDSWRVELGDDHADATSVDVGIESQDAFDAGYSADDLTSIYVDDASLSYSELRDLGFGPLEVMWDLGVTPFLG